MTRLEQTIGFIGAGNMGEAIIGALTRSGLSRPDEIIVRDPDHNKILKIHEKYGITVAASNFELFREAAIILLAVKPQVMEKALAEITTQPDFPSFTEKKRIISIAAGIPIRKLEALLYPHLGDTSPALLPIIRVMPNTPALVLSGMSGISGNQHVTTGDMETAQAIFQAMGAVIDVGEQEMDAVTALSGSGPAYVFHLAESMIDAGLQMGLEPHTAVTLSLKTIEGAARLMLESPDSPETLRKKVTSPGGTTEAAFQILESNSAKEVLIEAIVRAAERSRELSR